MLILKISVGNVGYYIVSFGAKQLRFFNDSVKTVVKMKNTFILFLLILSINSTHAQRNVILIIADDLGLLNFK